MQLQWSWELIEQLTGVATPMTAAQINGTTMAVKKALIERALGAELSHHWATHPAAPAPRRSPTNATASLPRRC